MKNFLVFVGANYYPAGGMEDFVGDFDTVAEAIKAAGDKVSAQLGDIAPVYDTLWANVYSVKQRKIIWENGNFQN